MEIQLKREFRITRNSHWFLSNSSKKCFQVSTKQSLKEIHFRCWVQFWAWIEGPITKQAIAIKIPKKAFCRMDVLTGLGPETGLVITPEREMKDDNHLKCRYHNRRSDRRWRPPCMRPTQTWSPSLCSASPHPAMRILLRPLQLTKQAQTLATKFFN